MAGIEVKGTNFVTFQETLSRLHGEEAAAQALERTPGEAGEALRSGAIVSSGWYPAPWYAALHAAAQEVTGKGHALSFEIAREGVKSDFRGIYRLLTFMLTPQSLLRKAPSVFRTYFRGGTMQVEAQKGEASVTFACAGFTEALWRDMEGGCVGVLEACGAEHVAVTSREGGRDGDSSLTLTVRWR